MIIIKIIGTAYFLIVSKIISNLLYFSGNSSHGIRRDFDIGIIVNFGTVVL